LEKREFDKAFVELIAPNIVFISVKEDIILEAEDITTIKAYNLKITQGKNYAVIVDGSHFSSISEEARKLMVHDSIEKNRIAIAIIIRSLPQRIVGGFYISVNKPSVPTKFCSNKEEALEWINKHLNQ